MTQKLLYLQNSTGNGPVILNSLQGFDLDIVQQYEAERFDWSEYQIVMVSMFSDQIHLSEMSDKISDYLDGGGTLIINGHIAYPFLPELSRYEPMPKRGLDELKIHKEAEHPLFEGVGTQRLTFRKGVSGFYGRGTNPPPSGAQILHSVGPDHVAVDWLYERPNGGRIFVHSGVELWMFLVPSAKGEASYLQQFFDWFSSKSEIAA